MCQFDNVRRSSSTGNCGTKAENEATSHKHALSIGWCLDGGPNNNDEAANNNAPATAVAIGQQTTKGECCNLTQVINNEYDAS